MLLGGTTLRGSSSSHSGSPRWDRGSTIRTASAGWIVGLGNPVIGREPRPERWIAGWSSSRFNPQQRLTMEQALASEIRTCAAQTSTGPTDLMVRYTDPSACERVNRVIARARMDGAARTPPASAGDGGATRATPTPASADGIRPGSTADGRLYLDVSFGEKEEAKRLLGARWDASRKLWYVDATRVTREQAGRWLPGS